MIDLHPSGGGLVPWKDAKIKFKIVSPIHKNYLQYSNYFIYFQLILYFLVLQGDLHHCGWDPQFLKTVLNYYNLSTIFFIFNYFFLSLSSKATYTIVVEARDHGSPYPLSATAKVVVTLTDVNDNPPRVLLPSRVLYVQVWKLIFFFYYYYFSFLYYFSFIN